MYMCVHVWGIRRGLLSWFHYCQWLFQSYEFKQIIGWCSKLRVQNHPCVIFQVSIKSPRIIGNTRTRLGGWNEVDLEIMEDRVQNHPKYQWSKVPVKSWILIGYLKIIKHIYPLPCVKWIAAGSQREELRPRQRSWGRRLRHTQRRDRASGNPLFPSIYPQNQGLPTLLFYALTYTSDFTGGWPPLPLSERELTYSSKSIKIPGCDKSVSTYKLLWRLSSLPVQVRPATCNCLQPPNCERHEKF